ncbi:hypothetical protein Sjap_000412 [Stephania japonica]|uniref:Uncharacterized protein n=1 Tax=Stephania japonica TaxID=461633 RepID=A0AAP0PQQ3_9MAGN
MSLYPVDDAHLATSFSSILKRSIGDHDTHRSTLKLPYWMLVKVPIHLDGGIQECEFSLIQVRIFSEEDMMAVQHRSFFEEQSRERKSWWSEEAILKSLKTRSAAYA